MTLHYSEMSWHQQRAAAIGAAAMRSGKDVQHGFRTCDCCGDYSCFGPLDDDEFFKCSTCEDTDCNPAETWHCFTGHCDGSGCSYHGECHLPYWWNVEFTYEDEYGTGLTVEIAAAGGGTVGKAYANNDWAYRVLRDGEPFYAGNDLRSGGAPQTHEQMAAACLDFLEAAHVIPERI